MDPSNLDKSQVEFLELFPTPLAGFPGCLRQTRACNDAHDARLPAPIETPVMLMMRLVSPCGPPVLVYRLRLATSKALTTVPPPMTFMRSLIGADWVPNDADDVRFVI